MRLRLPTLPILLLACTAGLSAPLLPRAWAASPETTRVTVLHTTDLHGALTSYDYLADRTAPLGLVRIASLVKAARAEGHPVLLLDNGDTSYGGPLEAMYAQGDRARPEPMMTAMTRLGYDAMALGNHEFSRGREHLDRIRGDAGFPWLAANVVNDADGRPAFDASLVKTLAAAGVIGLCTPAVTSFEDSAKWAGLRFLSPVASARAEARRLRQEERCDVVVVLAHTGLGKDAADGEEAPAGMPDENWGRRLAAEVPDADLVILGHTHALLPEMELDGVMLTQAGSGGTALGRVELELSREDPEEPWRLTSRRARVIAVTDTTPVDADFDALARPYHEAAEAALAEVVGEAAGDLRSPMGRLADGPLWDLVHASQLEATGADVSLAALSDPAIVIRQGPVTMRDVLRVLPYDNTLAVVELTGAGLRAALERSARHYARYSFEADGPLTDPDVPGYNCDAAQGVTYEVDLTRPAGERIVNLAWRGEPLAADQKLKVAVTSYRLLGGGGFAEIVRAPRVLVDGPTVQRALIDLIRGAGSLDGACDRNWRTLPDYALTPERPLVDLLVRQGVVPPGEVLRLFPAEPARRTDLAYWLARSYGWREKRLSGAFADAPDSLEPWLDGLLKRRVLGRTATEDLIHPFVVASLANAQEWCEAAARASGYALGDETEQASFRRSLLTGTSLVGPGGALPARRDTLTRAQLLGLIANTRFPTVRVLEITDFHGALLPTTRERGTRRSIGGSAVLAAWIARLRAENPEGTVVVDGGDTFQGTMISNLQYGRPVVEQLNLLGCSALAIGNHDFDWSADTLAQRAAEMRFSALGANMIERATGKMPRWVRSDTVFTRRGLRVGILGLCYTETPRVTLAQNVAHLRFEDDSATAARLVPRIRKRHKPHLLIEVGHTPAQSDSLGRAVGGPLARLARGIRGVDAWFGGHSHNRVVDEIGGAPVMIAGSNGRNIGVCDLTVDPVRVRVVEHRARLVTTYADEVAPDSAMAARVSEWNASVAELAAVPIGRSARALARGRGGESPLGNLVTDAMRAEVGTDVAFQNNGGLRADLPAGVITKGAIYEVMPFDNTVVVVRMTGAELRHMLEEDLARRRISQQSGLRYRADLSRPPMQRLVSIALADGSPLDDAKTYSIAVNNFMASGGDAYRTLTDAPDKLDTGTLVREAIERYIAERAKSGPLDVETDGRIERLDRDED